MKIIIEFLAVFCIIRATVSMAMGGDDPTVKFFAQSPGRIDCGESENLCIGSTHREDFRGVLQRLTEPMYVQRIDESFSE
jgi:hypothetical protein